MRKPVAVLIALLCVGAASAADDKKDGPSLRDLSQEVSALQTLYQLQVTKAQIVALKELSKDCADKSKPPGPGKGTDKVRKALANLREALVTATDAQKIADLADALDAAEKADMPMLNDETDITEEARDAAPKMLKLLTPKQVAVYGGVLAEELDDPVELLQEALTKARGLKEEKEWKQLRADIADQLARLLAGVDVDKAEEVGNKAVQLLIIARGLTDEEFKKEKPDLEKKVRAIAGGLGPTDVLRNVIEHRLAELLSNPRLAAALDARLK
jgi:hypothetical protein